MNEHLRKVIAHHDWWSETYDSDYSERFALYHRITLENIRRFLPKEKDKPILDAGGGTGIWSIELAKMGYQLVLTDISEGMLEKAGKKISELKLGNLIEVKISNICSMLEFEDDRFAMVLCQGDSLSYCGDHHAAIEELARVVQPGGVIIASVDSRLSAVKWLRDKNVPGAVQQLLETGDVIMPQKREEFCYNVHTFTPEELQDLFISGGLSVEKIIGKPVIADHLACFKSEDPAIQEWLYHLEAKYNADPAFYSWAGHLEIVGRKK